MMKKVNSSYRGYLAGLAGNFSCLLSVNIIITEAKGGTYGSRNPDGTWTGIIGQVMRKVCFNLSFLNIPPELPSGFLRPFTITKKINIVTFII